MPVRHPAHPIAHRDDLARRPVRLAGRRGALILGVSALALTLAWTDPVRAQSVWQGDTSTAYANGANWDTNAVPGAADDVQIGAGAPANPVLSTAETAGNFAVIGGGRLNVTNAGDLTVSTATIAAGGTIINAGVIASATALVNAGTLTTTGTLNGGLDSTGALNAAGTIGGAVALGGSGIATVTGALAGDSAVDVNGTARLRLTGGDFTGATQLTNTSTNTVGVDIGAGRELAVTSVANAAGARINVSGTLTTAGALDNAGTISSTGTIDANGGLNNSGTVNARGTINGAVANTGAGVFTVSGALAADSAFDNRDTARLRVSGGNLTGVTALTNTSAAAIGVDVAAGRTLSAQTVNNAAVATIRNAGTLTSGAPVSNAGTLNNTGTINGGVANTGTLNTSNRVNGGIASSAGAVNASGTVNGAIVNSGTSVFTVTGALVADSTLDNTGAADLRVTGGNLTGVTVFTNESTVTIGAGRTLEAATINNNAGVVTLGDGAVLRGTGNTLNNGATINVGANGTVTDAGAINNLAAGIINFNGAGGTSTLAAGGGQDIANDGQINVVAGDVDVTSGNLVVQGAGGRLNVTGGNMDVTAGVENNGSNAAGITISAGRTLSAASVINAATATINNSGNLTSGSVIDNDGTLNNLGAASVIAGGVSNSGTLANAGTVNGGVVNTGTVNTTNTINGGLSSSAGAVNASGAINGPIANSGTSVFTVTGALTGNDTFTNSGTARLLVSGGNFTGITTLANTSTAGIGVDISAGRTLSAQAVNNGGGATIRNAGILTSAAPIDNDGTLTNSGTVNGGIDNSGTLGNTGIINGGVANTGAVTTSNTINGGLSSSAGTVDASGAINGPIANSGTSIFTVTGALTGNDTFTNSGTARLLVSGGNFTGITTLANTSTAGIGVDISAGRTLSAQAVNNGGGATIRNAGILTSAALIDNDGTLTNSGTVNGGIDNSGTLGNTGIINGGVVNTGAVTTSNTINGGLSSSAGTVAASGAINGAIVNSGTSVFTVTGGLTGDNAFNNSATLNVTGGNFTGLTGLVNTGTINLADTRSLLTGGTINNNAGGVINLTGTTATVSTLANAGTINMTNGAISSVLNVAGNYSATAGVINLDVDLSSTNLATQRADRLVATGTTSGTTTLNFTNIGSRGYFANPINVVTDTGSTANFTTTGLDRNLLVIYTFQRAGNNWQIVSSLDAGGAGAAASSVTSALTSISTGFTEAASAFVSQPADPKVNQLSFGIWSRGKAGQYAISSTTTATGATAQSRWESSLAGFQIGADGGIFDINGSGFNLHFGLTGGTVVVKGKDAKFAGMSKTDTEAPFFGFYTALTGHGFFADLQVQRNYYDMALLNPSAGFNNAQIGGQGYTVVGSLGKQFVLGEASFIEPSIGLNWSRIKVEDVGIAGIGTVRTHDIESLLGSFRLRAGTAFQATETLVLQPTVTASVWHEFSGDTTGAFVSAGGTEAIATSRVGTFGQVGAGVTAQSLTTGLLGFVRADYRFGKNINGVAVNAGIRYQF